MVRIKMKENEGEERHSQICKRLGDKNKMEDTKMAKGRKKKKR